jgi:predicted ATPase/DNA-binding winged helix-turn-helix (wHTH) protein
VTTAYRFGSFELQADQRRLLMDGRPVAVGPRAFDLLLALVERPGQLVTKDELLDRVWPGLVVEANNLQVQISTLRKVLGPQAIATIPGHGYRWVLAAEDASAQSESTPPAPMAGSAAHSGVAVELPALYGRAEDVAALRELIRHHALVTVVGPAGIGKTRLAQAVAHELRDEFADGAVLVELAPLADADFVAATVARALGLAVGDPHTALDLSVQALASQRLLLVLDNCEHLLNAVDRMVGALRQGAPRVHVLATSQELLRHPDEHVWRLGALALPAEVTPERAREAGAIELFTARVQALDARFLVSDGNVAAVVDICRRLDGIPLAIEFAAARVPLLGVEGVRDRLDERFRLLTAGSRSAPRRHQTLHAALAWSYALLSEQEQRTFDGLGVFVGGFSLAAAQELASDAEIDAWAVLDHLGALVDKSLVIVDGTSARYRMLETTRAFALERLAARGATQPVLRRHAQVMLSLVERYYRDLLGGGVPKYEQVKRLAADLDNLRAAIGWASGPDGDLRTAVALVGATGAGRSFLTSAALGWEGWQWCKALKPRIDATIPTADAARFWTACAEQGFVESLETSAEDAQRAIALYRETQDRRGEFLAWDQLLAATFSAHRFDEASRAHAEASRLLDPTWPPRLRAGYENIAGLYFDHAGQPQEARKHYLAYLDLSRQMRSDLDELTALCLLAELDVACGQPDRAVEMLREPVARARASTPRYDNGMAVRNYATALMESGHLEAAESAFRDAVPPCRRAFGSAAFVLLDAACLLARRGRIDDAARVSAYAEGVHAAVGRKLRPLAQRNQEWLRAQLCAQRSPEALADLSNEGRALTDDQACRLAFPPLTAGA